MVNFWPFKSSEDAASFERTLSALSGKITRATARNDALRQRARRVRVMWTLYAGFAYILAALLLILVTGWRSWGATEISVVAGGPVVIYLVRTSLATYYDYRINNTQKYLETLNKERDTTIERLKTATKYNSTQQLLEKYGSSPKSQSSPSGSKKSQAQQQKSNKASDGPRTNIPPPPTANIQRPPPQQQQLPSTPQQQRPPSAGSSPQNPQIQDILLAPSPTAEFAPNAFPPPPSSNPTLQYSTSAPATFTQSHWYDRIMDALLGEDEAQPKNRLALICKECRLVNGQAPPGTKSLEDVGRWRCGGCRAWNGRERVEDGEEVVRRLVGGWEEERREREKEGQEEAEGEGEDVEDVEEEEDVVKEVSTPAKSTRSRTKGKGKK